MKPKKMTAPKHTSAKNLTAKNNSRKFRAPLQSITSGLNWRVVYLPFNVKEVFGTGRLAVRGTANGAPFRTTLFAMGGGRHMLHLNKQVKEAAGIWDAGDMVDVVIEPDTEERKVETPAVFRKYLKEDRMLLKFFESQSNSVRKWISAQVLEPKSAATRERRAERFATLLFEVMEGLRETPPVLKAEFIREPIARIGWERMTEKKRFQHLWGIFYYQNPESRKKRMEKALREMAEYAEKKKKPHFDEMED